MPSKPKNKCGTCQACCTVLAVGELKKPEYTPCSHLCWKGCGIHEKRPEECKTYECLWLQSKNQLSVDYRPDNFGIIVEAQQKDGYFFLQVRELVPGRIRDREVREFLSIIAEPIKAFIVLFTPTGERSLLCPSWVPKDLVDNLQGIIEDYDGQTSDLPRGEW